MGVKEGKIGSIEEIFLFSLPVKEAEIIDFFLKDKLQDEVMKIMPVQKQSSAGQRTRFKAFVAVGDTSGHIGLGVKCSSEVATAIRGAITACERYAPHRPLQGDRKVWIRPRSFDPRSSWYGSCEFSRGKEASAHGGS